MRILRILVFFVVGTCAPPAYAAQIYLNTEAQEYSRLDTFYVPIRLDTQGECINAVDIAIAYDPQELSVRDIATGDSIITLWTQRPVVLRDGDRELGRVVFQGGIPAGYCGRVEGDPGLTNTLAKLVVRSATKPTEPGIRTVTTLVVEPGSVVYKNDGLGSTAPLTMYGVELVLVQATDTPQDIWRQDVSNDTISPEYFDIQLVEGPSEGNKYHYIAFSTTDKQSGVDHYEVLETDPQQFGFLTWAQRPSYWVPAESPYVLRDQQLHSKILVKAIDRKGNERIVEYTPPMSPLIAYTRASLLIPLVLCMGLLAIAVALIVRFARTRKRAIEDTLHEESIRDTHET